MKLSPPLLALGACLAGLAFSLNAQPQTTVSDVLIEAPPGSPSPAPGAANPANGKPKKPKTPPSAALRHGSTADTKIYSASRTFNSERASRPLIIRNGKADAKTTSQLQEDLAVMAHIIEKSAAEFREEHEEAAGIPILTLSGNRGVRSIYLDDYGVLFTLTVNLPLRAEPKAEEAEEKRENGQNEEWLQARNELFGERRSGGRADGPPRREYDPHQVEEFRNALIDSLRNAANIRNLRPEDWVTIVVRGRGIETENDGQAEMVVRGFGGAGGGFGAVGMAAVSDDKAGESTTLVIRIKKSALEEAAHSKASPEALRAKASITSY